jgi:hypothetical protein
MLKNNKIKKIGLSLFFATVLLGSSAFADDMKNTVVPTVLTSEQIDDLVFMYQEEKVARDVYTKLNEKWGLSVFKNISRSEQRHMDTVKGLLIKYDIPVPITDEDVGGFVLPELQYLYDSLVDKGLNSEIDALEVGVAIEEKDILDIDEKIIGAPSDIARAFGNLLDGSYDHLDAFNKILNQK